MKTTGKITISAKTAKVALDNLADWLEQAFDITPETRSMIIGLDELVTALDAEDYLAAKELERQEANRKMHEEWQKRQEALRAEAGN